MSTSSIAIGSDHAGFECKESIKTALKTANEGFALVDVGTHSADSVDYPDFAHQVATQVESGEVEMGVVICGSGNGVCITANKHKGIRAALCWSVEIAALARQHNDANVLCIPARFVSHETALQMVETFMNTAFEGGRHQKRIEKI
ncbi:MAG: putative ribose-5-phosphate isomerase B [Bacteroidetes bacterium ADurb.Bin397]|jgi:ribose 5-phosphate isomerase B|nr:ribose 5-phosphate isomerase B [Bacteroidota bacterium]MBL7915453.1 ribose 5-phosphate isomerase B [Bacteroidia bacterium]OQA12742.1 MAG: putative ribose-5-phosphate isomerase B [Bacteroidetes bacterium ADurb.Bin397]